MSSKDAAVIGGLTAFSQPLNQPQKHLLGRNRSLGDLHPKIKNENNLEGSLPDKDGFGHSKLPIAQQKLVPKKIEQ